MAKEFDNTHFIFAKEGKILAFFEFDSVLREGAKELITYLKKEKRINDTKWRSSKSSGKNS